MQSAPIRLSKSKIAAFEHCPKRLWLQVYRRGEERFDDATLTRFQFGHDVGKRARFLVPNGILVETGKDMAAALAQTSALVDGGHRGPIFEATFEHANTLVRIDILRPQDDGWEIIEVKASSRVSEYQLADIATQVWVATGAGLRIKRATIRHLSQRIDWRHPDIGSVRFRDVDVSAEIQRLVLNRPQQIASAAAILLGGEPEWSMGSFCHRPLACQFQQYCQRCERIGRRRELKPERPGRSTLAAQEQNWPE